MVMQCYRGWVSIDRAVYARARGGALVVKEWGSEVEKGASDAGRGKKERKCCDGAAEWQGDQ